MATKVPKLRIPGLETSRPPTAVHTAFWDKLDERVRSMIDETLPVMAEVKGSDGGRLKVLKDDEDETRDVGFPKKLGNRYRDGDRVIMQRTKSGEWFVGGVVAGGGSEKIVGNPDLEDDSVDDKKIKGNSVKGDHIQHDQIDSPHLKNNAVKGANIAGNAVGERELNQNIVGKVNGAVQNSDVEGQGKVASTGYVNDKVGDIDTSQFVKSSELAKNAKGSKTLATEEWVNAKLSDYQKK